MTFSLGANTNGIKFTGQIVTSGNFNGQNNSFQKGTGYGEARFLNGSYYQGDFQEDGSMVGRFHDTISGRITDARFTFNQVPPTNSQITYTEPTAGAAAKLLILVKQYPSDDHRKVNLLNDISRTIVELDEELTNNPNLTFEDKQSIWNYIDQSTTNLRLAALKNEDPDEASLVERLNRIKHNTIGVDDNAPVDIDLNAKLDALKNL